MDECRSLIQAAEEAAKRNEVEAKRRREEMLLEQPELLWEDGHKNGTNGEWKKVNSLLLGELYKYWSDGICIQMMCMVLRHAGYCDMYCEYIFHICE